MGTNIKKVILTTLTLGLALIISETGSASHFYTVQLSSPLRERQAHELTEKLKDEGVATFEARVVIKGKKHYRVCSGYFENHKKAEEARRTIAKHTGRKNTFVQKLKGSQLPDRMVLGDFD